MSKSVHETASALHFIENSFGLPSLGVDDARADYYKDIFNFSQQAAKFKPLTPPSNYSYCMSQSNPPPETDY